MTAATELTGIGITLDSQRPQVASALQYIASHYCERITVAAVAAIAGYSERSIQERFRNDLGMRLLEVVLRLRLQRARQLLQQSSGVIHIREVAVAVGMPHTGRFAIHYREQYGETPTETLRDRIDAEWAERARKISRTPFPWHRS